MRSRGGSQDRAVGEEEEGKGKRSTVMRYVGEIEVHRCGLTGALQFLYVEEIIEKGNRLRGSLRAP